MEWPSLAEVVALVVQTAPEARLTDEEVIGSAKDWLSAKTGLAPFTPWSGEQEVPIRGRWGTLPQLLLTVESIKDQSGSLLLPTAYTLSPLGLGPYSRILLRIPGPERVTIHGEWGAFHRVPAWARRAVLVKAASMSLNSEAERLAAIGGSWREGDVSESQNASLVRQVGDRFAREAEDLALLHRRMEVWAS